MLSALYTSDSNPSATALIQEILSAPIKADLITLGHDLSELSTEDLELVKDILTQLGDQDGSSSQGEYIALRKPIVEGEPIMFTTAVDSGDQEEHLVRNRIPQPPSTPPFIPSPPIDPCLDSPKSPKSLSPTPKSPPRISKSPKPTPKSPTPAPKSLSSTPKSPNPHQNPQSHTKVPNTSTEVPNPYAPSS